MMSMIKIVGHAAMARWMASNLAYDHVHNTYIYNDNGLTAMKDGRFCSWQTVTVGGRQTTYLITISEAR